MCQPQPPGAAGPRACRRRRCGAAVAATASDVRADHISLLGWSNGGSGVLWTVRPRHSNDDKHDFRSAVAFYPTCRRLDVTAWSTRVPTLILIGGADDAASPQDCERMVAGAKGRSAKISIVVYPAPITISTTLAAAASAWRLCVLGRRLRPHPHRQQRRRPSRFAEARDVSGWRGDELRINRPGGYDSGRNYRRRLRNVFFHAIVSIRDFSASLVCKTVPSSATVNRNAVFSSSVWSSIRVR